MSRELQKTKSEGLSAKPIALVPGPTWSTFEQFRRGGNSVLEEIPPHGVGTLRGKAGTFRIIRDDDFQRLLGLATDIHRLQNGLNFVIQAAKVVAKHPDMEHVQLLIQSASMVAGSPVLPVREGHEAFRLTPEEEVEQSADDFDLATAEIPRPAL
jgi:hypothetical protein